MYMSIMHERNLQNTQLQIPRTHETIAILQYKHGNKEYKSKPNHSLVSNSTLLYVTNVIGICHKKI